MRGRTNQIDFTIIGGRFFGMIPIPCNIMFIAKTCNPKFDVKSRSVLIYDEHRCVHEYF